MRWLISGTVYYADGFEFVIDADTEDLARAQAQRNVEDCADYTPHPEMQEVCIEVVQQHDGDESNG